MDLKENDLELFAECLKNNPIAYADASDEMKNYIKEQEIEKYIAQEEQNDATELLNNTEIYDIIAERISNEIYKMKISQKELALTLHVGQSTIASYKRKDILPSLPIFALLCNVLEIEPNDILKI